MIIHLCIWRPELARANPTRPANDTSELQQSTKIAQMLINQGNLSSGGQVLCPIKAKVRDFEPLFDRPDFSCTTVNWTWKRLDSKLKGDVTAAGERHVRGK